MVSKRFIIDFGGSETVIVDKNDVGEDYSLEDFVEWLFKENKNGEWIIVESIMDKQAIRKSQIKRITLPK